MNGIIIKYIYFDILVFKFFIKIKYHLRILNFFYYNFHGRESWSGVK